jgi:hypothetical protein
MTAHTPAQPTFKHDSDCAVHNAPALPIGPCDCSMTTAHTPDTPVAWPCEIREADFESNIVTLKMFDDNYRVCAAQHWLCDFKPSPQPVIAPEWLKALLAIIEASDSDAASGGEMYWAEAVYPFIDDAKKLLARATGGAA